LPTYQFIHNDSPTNAGDVAMYISNKLKFEHLSNLELSIDSCEDLWIKLSDYNITVSGRL